MTSFNICLMNKSAEGNNKISNDLIISFLRLADNVISTNPDFLQKMHITRLSYFIKIFNAADIDSPLWEKLSKVCLNN